MQETNQTTMFKIDDRGRYTKVDRTPFIKSINYPVELFNTPRTMSSMGFNLGVNFSLIEGSLYLTFNQLTELFQVGDKVIRDHINNILGFWLHSNQEQNTGGGDFPPPQSLTMLEIPVSF